VLLATATDPFATSAQRLLGDARHDARRATLEQWGVALALGDDATVERVVRQSRTDRIWLAASGQLGTMLG
jgi:hypothetical protein